jgi:hypothetical protein
MRDDEGILWLDYFPGGVPASSIFKGDLDDLKVIASQDTQGTTEVCLIALVAYFEAFFKDHFAALINICPSLIRNLEKNGYDVTIKAHDVIEVENIEHQLGSLLTEKYDFGTGKRINALYQALLIITPFSKDEMKQFDDLLNDRNLLVHHGGIITLRYFEQTSKVRESNKRVFMDSLTVSPEMFFKSALFAENIVRKTAKATKNALLKFMENNSIYPSGEKSQAIEFSNLWLENGDIIFDVDVAKPSSDRSDEIPF